MEALGYLEILDRRGRVRSRVRVDALPMTIGRAYTNDVILDDRYVCPRHALLRRNDEGILVLEDLNSVNGVHAADGRRAEKIVIDSGTQMRIGNTSVRFIVPIHAVEPAQTLGEGRSLLVRLSRHQPTQLMVLVGGIILMLLVQYLQSYERIEFAKLLMSFSPVLFAYAFWAGGWALATRIVTQEFRLRAHLTVAFAATIAFIVAEWLSDYVEFWLSPDRYWNAITLSWQALIITLLLYAHLRIISITHPARKFAYSALAALSIYSLSALELYVSDKEFSASIDFPAVVMPVRTNWLPAVTSADFFADATVLRDAVDRLAESDKPKH